MEFVLDPTSGRPVYQQLIDQVKREVALARLRPGDRLPTVRDLAARLVLNPNTIAKAYRQLEQDGIIATRPGAGAFIAELGSRLSETVQRRIVTDHFERGLVDGITMGKHPGQLNTWFHETLSAFDTAPDAPESQTPGPKGDTP